MLSMHCYSVMGLMDHRIRHGSFTERLSVEEAQKGECSCDGFTLLIVSYFILGCCTTWWQWIDCYNVHDINIRFLFKLSYES